MLCCILGWIGTNILEEPVAARQQATLKMEGAGFSEILIPTYQTYGIMSHEIAV
jgi:hypothetical protein